MRNPFSYRFGLPSPFYDNETGVLVFVPFIPLGSTGLITADNLTFKARE